MVTSDNLTSNYSGLATDIKPTNGRNGDTFVEMDTGKLFMYDEENSEWVEISTSGGGGGGDKNVYVEVSGTLANPWGSIDYAELVTKIDQREAVAMLYFEGSQIPGGQDITGYLEATPRNLFMSGAILEAEPTACYEIFWGESGSLGEGYMEIAGVNNDITEYIGDIPTELTVLYISSSIPANPNWIETVTGTAAAILPGWSEEQVMELMEKLYLQGNATAYLSMDCEALGLGTITQPLITDGSSLCVQGFELDGSGNRGDCAYFGLAENAPLIYAVMMTNGETTDITQYASAIPTSLKIIWHQMPTAGS